MTGKGGSCFTNGHGHIAERDPLKSAKTTSLSSHASDPLLSYPTVRCSISCLTDGAPLGLLGRPNIRDDAYVYLLVGNCKFFGANNRCFGAVTHIFGASSERRAAAIADRRRPCVRLRFLLVLSIHLQTGAKIYLDCA